MALPGIRDRLTTIEVLVRDDEDQLVKMIEYIRSTAGIGHSFEVIVDPDTRDYTKKFYFDGDGAFFIKEVKRNKKKVKVKDDKLIEGYLKRIQC